MLLKNKKVLIGVTGSIAIYKALEVIRLFIKSGAEVRVVMTESAKRFITPLTFEAISQNRVLEQNSEEWSSDNNHIAIARWADIYIIAPSSANTINKLANGIADNLVTQIALATDRVKIIAPSANTKMLENSITKHSIKMLELNNYTFISTQNKLLACMEEGEGALATPLEIFYYGARELLKEEFWINRRVVVTGGGVVERIDDVRYISNFSSGKMAKELSKALFLKGADVCLITTKLFEDLPKDVYIIDVESSSEMKEYLIDAIRVAKKGVMTKPTLIDDSVPHLVQKTPFLFMASAVSDYIPKYTQRGKLKKEFLGEVWNLELKRNEDILKSINKEGVITIGFKAEMDRERALESAKKMLIEKNLDGVALNILSSENSFGSDKNEIDLITKDKITHLKRDTKLNISFKLLEEVKKLDEE